jgi:tetratricopeptide (TPR) repeat protein
MTPVVLQSGNLAESTFVDLVMEAREAGDATILEVVRPTSSRSFYFRDGKMVALVTSSKGESFTAMLVRRKKIQRTVAESVETVAVSDGLTPAQVMLRDRMLPIPELVKELGLWATLLLIETFGWSEGEYRIIPEQPGMTPPETLLEVNLPGVILKGVFKRMEIDEIRAMLRPFHEARPRQAAPLPFAVVGFDLDAHQQRFWESLDGARTVAEILEFPALPKDDAARLLFALHHCGMVILSGRPKMESDPWGDRSKPGMDLSGLFDDPDLGMDPEPGSIPEFEPPPPPAEPEPPVGASGVDFSSIRFRRGARSDGTSGTFHSVTGGPREEFESTTSGVWKVGVGVGRAEDTVEEEASTTGLSGLFDGLDIGTPSPPPAGKVAPPRSGQGGQTWRSAGSAPGSPPPDTLDVKSEPDPDAPPMGPGPTIEQEDWDRLTTRDKERVASAKRELAKMESTHYFQWFGISHETPVGSVKKAYFQMAKLYHPDSLIDEPEIYRACAEALFANYSTAYETLSDEEARDKYVRKIIFGEKDENDLAMERVQQILAAENSFKTGQRFLNAGKLKDALRHFKAAVEGYEDEAEYVAYYGYVLFKARIASDPAAAEDGIGMIHKAISMKEMAPKPYHLLGRAHMAKGEPMMAKRQLRKSLKLKPDQPEVIRDYRKADEMEKTGAGKKDASKGGKKGGGLFGGVFGRRKKKDDKPEEDLFEGLDLDL